MFTFTARRPKTARDTENETVRDAVTEMRGDGNVKWILPGYVTKIARKLLRRHTLRHRNLDAETMEFFHFNDADTELTLAVGPERSAVLLHAAPSRVGYHS